MPSLAFTADSRQTEAGRLYNRSEEDETRIPLQKAIDDADYEHGHRVHELDFLTAFRSPRLRQPPKRLDKRVPQDGIGARLGHPRPSLRCPGQPRAAGAPPRPPNPQDQLTSTADVWLCGLKSPGSRLRPPFFGDVTFFFTITAPPW